MNNAKIAGENLYTETGAKESVYFATKKASDEAKKAAAEAADKEVDGLKHKVILTELEYECMRNKTNYLLGKKNELQYELNRLTMTASCKWRAYHRAQMHSNGEHNNE